MLIDLNKIALAKAKEAYDKGLQEGHRKALGEITENCDAPWAICRRLKEYAAMLARLRELGEVDECIVACDMTGEHLGSHLYWIETGTSLAGELEPVRPFEKGGEGDE